MQPDTIGNRLQEVQKAVQDLDKFGKTVELVGLAPFQGTQDALQEINDISEGILSDFLRATLETNLPVAGKKKTVTLGVSEKNLAGSIKAAFPNLACETSDTSEVVSDLLRGLRQHSGKLIKKLQAGDIDRSLLGLGHAVRTTMGRTPYEPLTDLTNTVQQKQGQVLSKQARQS